MPTSPPSPGLAPSQPAIVSHPPQPSTPHEPQTGVQLPHVSGVLAQLPGSQLVQEDFDPWQPAKPAAKPIVRSIETPCFIANFLFYHAWGETSLTCEDRPDNRQSPENRQHRSTLRDWHSQDDGRFPDAA